MPAPPERLAHHWDAQIKARLGEWAYLLTLQSAQLAAQEEVIQRQAQELETRPAVAPPKVTRRPRATAAVAAA